MYLSVDNVTKCSVNYICQGIQICVFCKILSHVDSFRTDGFPTLPPVRNSGIKCKRFLIVVLANILYIVRQPIVRLLN